MKFEVEKLCRLQECNVFYSFYPNQQPLVFSFAAMRFSLLIYLLFAIALSDSLTAQTWARVGTGTNGAVHALTTFNDGISVGGTFTQINAFDRIAHCFVRENKLDEYTFFAPYSEAFNVNLSGAATLSAAIFANAKFDARLHVGGRFNHPDYADNVGLGYFQLDPQTNATSFQAYDVQLSDSQTVFCMLEFDGRLFIGGDFESLGNANYIASINSGDYPTPTVNAAGNEIDGPVHVMAVFQGQLYAGGNFSKSDTDTVFQNHISRWNGTDWEMVGDGLNRPVYALYAHQDKLYAGGVFTASDSNEMLGVASWDGTSWSAVGTGFTDSADTVFCLYAYDDTLYAGGNFDSAGNQYVQNIAKLAGTEWRNLGDGINGPVYDMHEYRGRLYIGGAFTKADALISRNLVTYNNGNVPFSIDSPETPSLRIYPNPASNVVHFDSKLDIKTAKLYSILGSSIPLSVSQNSFDIQNIPSGYYLLQSTDSDGLEFQQPLIIQQ